MGVGWLCLRQGMTMNPRPSSYNIRDAAPPNPTRFSFGKKQHIKNSKVCKVYPCGRWLESTGAAAIALALPALHWTRPHIQPQPPIQRFKRMSHLSARNQPPSARKLLLNTQEFEGICPGRKDVCVCAICVGILQAINLYSQSHKFGKVACLILLEALADC